MPTFKLKITQVARVEYVAIIDVEADDIASALTAYADEDMTPSFDEPIWASYPDLQDEDVVQATADDIARHAADLPKQRLRALRSTADVLGDAVAYLDDTLTELLESCCIPFDSKPARDTLDPADEPAVAELEMLIAECRRELGMIA